MIFRETGKSGDSVARDLCKPVRVRKKALHRHGRLFFELLQTAKSSTLLGGMSPPRTVPIGMFVLPRLQIGVLHAGDWHTLVPGRGPVAKHF